MFVLMLVYLILTIVRPQDYMPALVGVPLMPVVMISAALLWLLSRDKHLAAPQYLLVPMFLLAMIASMLMTGWVGGALLVLQVFGPIVIAFVLLANSITNLRRVTWALAVIVLCSTLLALHGVDQIQQGIGWTGALLSEDTRIQYIGIFNDPNDLGLLFVSAIPMAVYLMGRGGGAGLMRLLWLGCAMLMLYGVYLTKSRGAMVALIAVVGVYFWRKRGVVQAVIMGLICLTVLQFLSPRMEQLSAEESSAYGRVDAWYVGLHLFMEHPLFGVGAGQFVEHNSLTAHNSFVLALAETGIFGYTVWLTFLCFGLWMMFAVLRFQPELADTDSDAHAAWRQHRSLAMALLLSQVGLLAAAFFLSRTYVVVLYLFEAVVVGFYFVARKNYPDLREFRLSEGWVRWPLLSVLSIVVLFVVVRVLLMVSS